MKLTGSFTVTSWDEEPYLEGPDQRKLSRASGTQDFDGGVEGTGSVQWLMCYAPDGTARFVGLQHVDGTLEDRRGTFVVETVGEFDGSEAKGTWSVVPGSGTGDLADVTGTGSFKAPMGSTASYELSIE
jgi:Protein of unknown function (DUF3224)